MRCQEAISLIQDSKLTLLPCVGLNAALQELLTPSNLLFPAALCGMCGLPESRLPPSLTPFDQLWRTSCVLCVKALTVLICWIPGPRVYFTLPSIPSPQGRGRVWDGTYFGSARNDERFSPGLRFSQCSLSVLIFLCGEKTPLLQELLFPQFKVLLCVLHELRGKSAFDLALLLATGFWILNSCFSE